jgi:hypothetical protein
MFLTPRVIRRSPFFVSMLTNGNYFFTAIFAFESSIKLSAMSPRYFFSVRTEPTCLSNGRGPRTPASYWALEHGSVCLSAVTLL